MLLAIDSKKKIVPLPETLAIKQFSVIWEKDTSEDKENALKELAFVYYYCAYDSPYNAFSSREKEQQLKKDFDIAGPLTVRIKEAIKKYNQLQISPSLRFLQAAQKACESMIQYFEGLDFSERDDYGRPVYKASEVSKCLKDCNGIIESLSALRERVSKELSDMPKIRGGGNIGIFEETD